MRTALALLMGIIATLTIPAHAAEEVHRHQTDPLAAPPLAASGNDAFGAIKEIVDKLIADSQTDWNRVDLEALRKHLVDMHHLTLNVAVKSQKPIEGGVEFTVMPSTPESTASLERLIPAHSAMLKQELGWEMHTTPRKGSYVVRVTSPKTEDIPKIRGLGYIGIVAMGQHHQPHHWRMATGAGPHQEH